MQVLLPFLSKVRKAEGSRRLVFAFSAHRDDDQNDDRNEVRKHLEELLRRASQARDVEIEPEENAEEVGAPDSLKRLPACEDNKCNSEPAEHCDTAVVGPGALDVVHNVVQAAKTSNRSTYAGGEILVSRDVDAGCVSSGGVFAHRAEVKTLASTVQEIA